MMRNILNVDLKDFRSYFNYDVMFFCYLLSFCCESADNRRRYGCLDTHKIWGRTPNLLPTRV